MITWSISLISKTSPAHAICVVNTISFDEGIDIPLGWLWATAIAVALAKIAPLKTFLTSTVQL